VSAIVPAKRRGRVSFADADFTGSTSLASLPDYEREPTSAPLDELANNPHNPREGYDDEAMRELADSLRETGQLQSVSVVSREVFLAHYPDTVDAIGSARWVVLTGNRRLAAARLAGLDRLAMTVSDRLAGADPRLSEATVVENLHREALPPLLEARELAALVERHGSQSAVAKRVSKTQPWVSQRLALLRLSPAMQDELRDGTITVREARSIAAADPEDQRQALDELRRHANPSPAEPSAETPAPVRRTRSRPATRSDGTPTGDVDAIARELRTRLTAEQLVELVSLLSRPGPITR
jgi:ParB family chromosome partitioning protein